jgi:hypothetical protein
MTRVSTSSSTRPVEDGGHLRQVARVGRRRPEHRRRVVVGEKDDLDVVAVPQADGVAVQERPLGDLFVVDERAVARGAVAQQVAPVVVADDFGMLARHVGADELQIGGRAPSDQEDGTFEPNDAPALTVGYLKTPFSHRGIPPDSVTGGPAGPLPAFRI